MPTITLEEAQARLAELIHRLAPGEGVTITENDRPVATLVTLLAAEAPRPVPGRCRGMLTVIAEDDEHLSDWAEYMGP
jgi:antitoxin (DNA-binding transcriptional repressor) of toxin-antitoxin stability system